ncbi:kinase-like domain-containing protein, partial [Coemansia mojavensis]
MNTYSLLAETSKEKIVIKIVDNVLKSRKLLRNNVEALRIISKEPRIPAPKILIYREGLLVTTFIEGIPYSECKDNNIKAKAREDLKEVIIAMRNIRSSHGKYLDITRCEDENITIDEAIKLYPWVERCKDEGFVMSHNDLHTSNVIVNDTGLAGVIDWELAGFYPSSYE